MTIGGAAALAPAAQAAHAGAKTPRARYLRHRASRRTLFLFIMTLQNR
jgi:hypothetical protein